MYQYRKDGTPVYPHEAEAKAKKELLQQARATGMPQTFAAPYGLTPLETAAQEAAGELLRLKQQLAQEAARRAAAEARVTELELQLVRADERKARMGQDRIRSMHPIPPVERRPVLIRDFSAWYEEKHGVQPDLLPDAQDELSWTALHLVLLADEVNRLSRLFPAAESNRPTNRPVEASDVI